MDLDPRPRFTETGLAGSRCPACGLVAVPAVARCHACWLPADPIDDIEPTGTVWSSTIVHLPVGPYEAPFGLAYVDLDAGARVLAHTDGTLARPDERVRLQPNEHGDAVAVTEGVDR